MRLPSGEKATESTLDAALSVSSSFPLCASHTLAASELPASALPVTMRLPSGEKATELTLDPMLSVRGSTAVGKGAVVKAVSGDNGSNDGAMETDGFAEGAESERGCFACRSE